MNKNTRLAATAIGACIILILALAFRLWPKSETLELVNDAQESAIHATVEINGATFDFDNIPPDGIRHIKYKPQAGNHYKITIEFRYDRKLEQTGYFNGHIHENKQLVIKKNEIVLEEGK